MPLFSYSAIRFACSVLQSTVTVAAVGFLPLSSVFAFSVSVPSCAVEATTFTYLSSGGILVSLFLSVMIRVTMSPGLSLPESPAARLFTVKLIAVFSPFRLANVSFSVLPNPDSFSFLGNLPRTGRTMRIYP